MRVSISKEAERKLKQYCLDHDTRPNTVVIKLIERLAVTKQVVEARSRLTTEVKERSKVVGFSPRIIEAASFDDRSFGDIVLEGEE